MLRSRPTCHGQKGLTDASQETPGVSLIPRSTEYEYLEPGFLALVVRFLCGMWPVDLLGFLGLFPWVRSRVALDNFRL